MPTAYTSFDILNDPDFRDGIIAHFILASRVYKKYLGRWEHVRLNEQILFEAIGSCYCDIYRLRVFRNIRQEDVHKRSAFLLKWICKFRPIQVVVDRFIDKTTALLANEIFAMEVVLTILNINPDEFFRNRRYENYARNMVYLLRFHSCEAEQLASELFLLEQIVKK